MSDHDESTDDVAELEDESDEATDDDEKDGPKDRRGDDEARNVGGSAVAGASVPRVRPSGRREALAPPVELAEEHRAELDERPRRVVQHRQDPCAVAVGERDELLTARDRRDQQARGLVVPLGAQHARQLERMLAAKTDTGDGEHALERTPRRSVAKPHRGRAMDRP